MNTPRTSQDISRRIPANPAYRAPARFVLVALTVFVAGTTIPGCRAMRNSSGGSARNTTTTTNALLSGFIAFGDFGGGDGQVAVAAAMSTWATSHRVDALVTTGDNVYEAGEPAKYPAQLDAPYASLRSTRPLWATLGNHDAQHGAEELRYLKLPPLPYIRELPGVQLLFLDANRPDAAQATWLDQQLAAAGPRVRVVVFHQPAYSCGVHGSTAAVDQQWVPVFEKHRVALVLNGHDHDYERFTGPAEVNYVVTGGGGQAVYPTLPLCAPRGLARRASATRHHFTFVEVHEHSFTIQAVATDGTVFDRVTVTR